MRTVTRPGTPEHYAVHPNDCDLVKESTAAPRNDLLSGMLQSIHLSGEHLLRCAPKRPFCVSLPDSHGVLHLIDSDEIEICLVDDAGLLGEPVLLQPGDVALLPRGHEHAIRTPGLTQRTRQLTTTDLVNPAESEPTIHWLSGSFVCVDNVGDSRLAALPPLITFRRANSGTPDWLAMSRAQLQAEVAEPSQGSSVMIARILDLVFIQVLRAWASTTGAESSWLAGAMDPTLGPVLAALHLDPGKAWTVVELARVSNLSRSTFADKFARVVGLPPATYLTDLRMEIAARKIKFSTTPVRTIARESGYSSEAAFSRAFRRKYDRSPSQWRTEKPA